MKTVLFAHGDPELRDLSVSLLSPHGYEVETAGGGVECLNKLRRRVPDLLVLEVNLPWGGGDGVLRAVRNDPQLRPGRVVVTSAVACTIRSDLLDRAEWGPQRRAGQSPACRRLTLERLIQVVRISCLGTTASGVAGRSPNRGPG